MKKEIYNYFIGTLFAVLVSFFSYEYGWLNKIENILYDLRVNLLSSLNSPSKNIKLIVIDQNSLQWAEKSNGIGWPWPREMYSAINSFLHKGHAKMVIYDMIYSEPSFYGSEDDKRFAATLQNIPSVGAIVLTSGSEGIKKWPSNIKEAEQSDIKLCQDSSDKRLIMPTENIFKGFESIGIVNANVGSDGIIRKFDLCHKFGDDLYLPTLAALAYKKLSKDTYALKNRDAFINYYNSPFSFKTYSAASIIDSWIRIDNGEKPIVSQNEFKDSIVFVGVSAMGLHDNKATPLSSNHPGVDIQATILDNLFQQNAIYKSSNAILIWIIVLTAFLTTLIIYFFKKIWKISLSISTLIIALFLFSFWLYLLNTWLPLAPILLSMIIAAIITGILGYIFEGRQKQFIKNAFNYYLSPKVVQNLIDNPDQLLLGGKTQTLTIFFSDIAGFTTISEQLKPKELVSLLNSYLDEMSEIILKYDGTIDKYEGDAIVAFWNAPLLQQDHADLAVKAAIEYQKRLHELSLFYKQKYNVSISARIGLHTGDVVIGNIGSQKRFDYSFIGDAGNLASRLEGANKFFKTDILFSSDTYKLLDKSIKCRKIATVIVVGKEIPIEIFEPLPNNLSDNELLEFGRALNFFENENFTQAAEIFKKLSSKDKVSQNYLSIIKNIKDKKTAWRDAIALSSK